MLKEYDLKKISVVIPMYNSEDTIISTLDSIMNQTSFNHILEIIIVNDGSTDKSLDIVKEYIHNYSENYFIIIDKINGGVSSARNAGMRVAKGEWIALLDSDDEWLPNKIELQMKTIKEHPEIDFLGGDTNSRGLKIFWKRINGLYKANVRDVCLKMFPQPSTAIFRRDIYKQMGGFDESQRYAEDGNYFLKICAHYNYYHLSVEMVYYGAGKIGFGVRGLSANLKEMYKGNVKNINDIKNALLISNRFYLFLRVFYWLKYIRRIVLTKIKTW